MQLEDEFDFGENAHSTNPLPAIELRLQVPKLPGQDTSHFNKLEYRVLNNRRAYHVECDKRYSSAIRKLTQLAKECGIVIDFWGKHAHISEVADHESTPSEIKSLCQVAQKHTNYQLTMVVEDILGITNLDAETALYNKDGNQTKGLSLRHVLLTKFKLSDGFQLIAEVHQASAPMSPVQVVVPQTPEAEKMVLMMNKNFPAFLTFVLRDLHFPEQTIIQYVKRCCCQVKAAEITLCKWDSTSATLTTPDDLGKRSTDDFSSASWYKDAFSELGLGPKGKKNAPPPPENLFRLDEERSVFTIHKRNERHHDGKNNDSISTAMQGEGANPIDLTTSRNGESVDLTESDEGSASSSSNDSRPLTTATTGEDIQTASSPSSDEENGGAALAADAE